MIEPTDDDREWARRIMVDAWNKCNPNMGPRTCDCDHGAIDGCKVRVEEIAIALATARKI